MLPNLESNQAVRIRRVWKFRNDSTNRLRKLKGDVQLLMIITILLQVTWVEYAKYVIMFPIQDYGDGFVTSIISQQAFFYYLLSFASVIFLSSSSVESPFFLSSVLSDLFCKLDQ